MIENMINELTSIVTLVETTLTEKLTKEGDRMKFVDLLDKIRSANNFDMGKMKNIEPVIRLYIKDYSNFEISRGRDGGVRLKQDSASKTQKSSKSEKTEKAATQDKTKEEMKALIEKKIAEQKAMKAMVTETKAEDPVQMIVSKSEVAENTTDEQTEDSVVDEEFSEAEDEDDGF